MSKPKSPDIITEGARTGYIGLGTGIVSGMLGLLYTIHERIDLFENNVAAAALIGLFVLGMIAGVIVGLSLEKNKR